MADHLPGNAARSSVSSRQRKRRAESGSAVPDDIKILHTTKDSDNSLTGSSSPGGNDIMPTPSLSGDWANFLLLLFLYILQGIPIGLASSVPLYLVSKGVGFSELATFSLASWPYSLKLLWAPVVDALYTTKFNLGHRKSWIIPTQFIAGIVMILLSSHLDAVFGGAPEDAEISGGKVNVAELTLSFFVLYFLVATQDIAVDGWGLTILRPENVGYASTANNVGQLSGIMLAFGIFMAFDSATFCNNYVRPLFGLASSDAGMVTMSQFLYFWGAIFIVSTLCLWIFKREDPPTLSDDHAVMRTSSGSSLQPVLKATWKNYQDLWSVLRIKHVRFLALVLLTGKMAYTAIDSGLTIVLQQRGMSKEVIALTDTISTPILLLAQVALSAPTSGPNALSIHMRTHIFRLVLNALALMLVQYGLPTMAAAASGVSASTTVIALFFVLSNALGIVASTMFLSQMSFFTQVADPKMGGTYMTLLNTLSNLGSKWPQFIVLRGIAWLNQSSCSLSGAMDDCAQDGQACKAAGGECTVSHEGFLQVAVVSTLIGFVWWAIFRDSVVSLQDTPKAEWRVTTQQSKGKTVPA